jgi:hypothetical protein
MSYFDFSATFEKAGGLFRKRLRRLFETQTDLEGRRFERPALSTLKQRARLLQGSTSHSRLALLARLGKTPGKTLKGTKRTKKSGAPTSVPLTRLYVTHDLALRGFRAEHSAESVRIYVSEDAHIDFYGTNPSLADLIRWNSKGQARLNPRVGSKAPLVFPNNDAEIQDIKPEFGWVAQMLERDALVQARAKLKLQLRAELRV